MISFRNFALRRGERLLLSEVDLALHAGWRVGVVGRNGTGKSSLFAVLMGDLEPDKGDLDLPGKARIASVAQETPSLPDPALDFVLSGDAAVHAAVQAEANAFAAEDWEAVAEAHQRLEELNGYDASARAGRLLHGLGFPADTHPRPVSDFSGGWRVRLNVGRALMTPSDLLLLDEPTNHLDLDAVVWLEEWLRRYPGTLLVISHDREFLDNVTTHTLHLHDGKAKLYAGNYTQFERQRAEHLRQQQIAFEKEQAERAHLQKFIDRFKAKASKAKQAQSRMKRLEKLAGTEAVRAEREFRIEFPAPAKMPFALMRLNDADCGYGADAVILHDVGFGLEAGDRIGLLGVNGAGKSTFAKMIAEALVPEKGEYLHSSKMRVGWFHQHQIEALDPNDTALEIIRRAMPEASESSRRSRLAQFGLPFAKQETRVDSLSGGERARLLLNLVAMEAPHVLILDEPTNHLDIDSRRALLDALNDYQGAVILITHDRSLMELVADRLWLTAEGTVKPFDGDMDDYARYVIERAKAAGAKPRQIETLGAAAEPAPAPAPAKPKKKDGPSPSTLRFAAKKAEDRMTALSADLARLDDELANAAVSNPKALEGLSRARAKAQADLDAAEAAWVQAEEALAEA